MGVGGAFIVRGWRLHETAAAVGFLVVAAAILLLSVYGATVLLRERRATEALARTMAEQRELSATLEQAVQTRTMELEDAQRVLKRMWSLGQQITLELNPQRVLDRFLEAVVDIAQADGGVVALMEDEPRIRFAVGVGIGAPFVGAQIPLATSAIGRVIRSGRRWAVTDMAEHRNEFDEEMFARTREVVRGLAVVPVARRGERIGAVVLGSTRRRLFDRLTLDRVEAMADLLSVSLENAELVENLRQAEWRFRTLFRAAPDAVFTVLQSGRIREANDAVREVVGCDPLQVVGRPLVDLVADADRLPLREALDAAFAGHPARLDIAFRGEHSARRFVALAMRRLPEADPPTVLLVGRDMTSEREMRVRLMEADRLAVVGELVAGVAHEVNNPLSSISAFAQLLLRDGELTAAHRESVEVIRAETLRASQVVKDLLAFARRSEPQREPVDVNAVVSRTLRLRAYQMTSNKITVEQSVASDLPAVIGDARQLQQVFLNLVTNAIQAMSTLGGGTLFVSTVHDDGRVVLDVRDTGPGVPDAARVRIFEPFFTTKREGEGTGLGLSVSYGIIAAHGGTIELATSSQAGSTFRVTLPAACELACHEDAREPGAAVLRSPLAGLRLLFVDDEASLRSGMQAFGDMRGFAVVPAGGGIEALELLRSTPVDAVVCDLRMPGMDGVAFHERLRRERPGLASRTVFITGDVVTTAGRTAAVRQPILPKPFAFEKLEETLVTLLHGSSAAGGQTARRRPSQATASP